MPVKISSLQNQHVKQAQKLNSRRYRDKQQETLVEGVREVGRALESGLIPLQAFLCPPLFETEEVNDVLAALKEYEAQRRTAIFEVPPAVFQKIAYRGESGGILLIVPYFSHSLDDIHLGQTPFLAIIEGVEKPGNLGAILRTADAAGVDGVFVCSEGQGRGTDIHNPNVIRASLGASFTVPVVEAENGRLIQWLLHHKIQIIAATPDGSRPYTAVDMTGPTAVVMGSEAHGLSRRWLQNAHHRVVIPMYGKLDSLNLSVATALLLYEVVRQRI